MYTDRYAEIENSSLKCTRCSCMHACSECIANAFDRWVNITSWTSRNIDRYRLILFALLFQHTVPRQHRLYTILPLVRAAADIPQTTSSSRLAFTNVHDSFSFNIYIGWRWRNFVPYLCQLVFAAILWVKLREMFVTVIVLKYALLVSQYDHMEIFWNQLIQFRLNNTLNLRPLSPHIIPCYTHKMATASWPQTTWRHFTPYMHLHSSFW